MKVKVERSELVLGDNGLCWKSREKGATMGSPQGGHDRSHYMRMYYPESAIGGFTSVDGTIEFYTRVNAILSLDANVLDVGCGRGAHAKDSVAFRRNLRVLRGKCRRVIGIDIDLTARENPFLDEFREMVGPRWPIDDGSVDLCVADYVVEHLQDPRSFFEEARRVLRSGGYLCIRTPNVMSYLGLASRLTPNRFHPSVLQRVQEGRLAEDVFPTAYRCNTQRAMRRMLRETGYDAVVYGFEAEPAYLGFSRLAYAIGVFHQRFAPTFLKLMIFAFGKKL